ncbi:MFS transporter [Streptomyces sp. NPDC020858]|uniref:MFS transporter n=1 Tax=Streptomyces sp. NPDC020858 TaxID=3365097 RepID=UPI0037B57113
MTPSPSPSPAAAPSRSPSSSPAPGRLRRALGLPSLRGHGRFVTGNLVDSLGSGMLLPLGLLYFTTARDLSVSAVGAAVTIGQLAALPVVFLAGRFMDRRGPRRVTVVANVVSAVGFLSFLVAAHPWQIACAYLLVQSGVNAYYTAQRTLITRATAAGEARAWFAFTGSLRNVGLGLGAGLAAGMLGLFGTDALGGLVASAAPLYLLAAVCFARVPLGPPAPKEETGGGQATNSGNEAPRTRVHRTRVRRSGGDGAGHYLLLVACNVPFVLAQSMLSVLIALYATRSLGLAAWTASLLLVLNTVMVSLLTSPLTAHVAPAQRRHAVALGYALLAASMPVFAAPALNSPGIPAWPALLVAMVLFSLAEIFYSPAMNELSVTLTPSAARGSRQSLYQLSWALGGITAPALFTLLLDAGALWPWIVQGAACLLALAAVPALRTPTPPGPDEAGADKPDPDEPGPVRNPTSDPTTSPRTAQ